MTQQYHIIVESESAVNHVLQSRRELCPENTIFHTTSPWLLEKLMIDDWQVCSLEKGISDNVQKQLGRASVFFAAKVAALLNDINKVSCAGYLMGQILERNIQQTVYMLLYKAYLLVNWHQQWLQADNHLLVVGDSTLTLCKNFFLDFSVFDTLYAVLADSLALTQVDIVPHKNRNINASRQSELDARIIRWERYLSFSNVEFKSLFSYLWVGLQTRGLIKSNRISIRKKPHISVFYFKNCKPIHELFIHFLMGSAEIFNYTNRCHVKLKHEDAEFDKDLVVSAEVLQSILTETLEKQSLTAVDSLCQVAQLLSIPISQAFYEGSAIIPQLKDYFSELLHAQGRHKIIITNHMTAPIQKLAQQFLLNNGVLVFNFQHGVTAGVDGSHTLLEGKNYSSFGQDYWCCQSMAGLKAHTKELDSKGGIVTGVSRVERVAPGRAITRWIFKKALKINRKQRVVLYLPSLSRNNQLKIPTQNDLAYYSVTRQIVFDVFAKNKDYNILKLYPAVRPIYADPDPFDQLVKMPDNVTVLKQVDFSLLRSLPDVIIVNFGGSTFGVAFSARVPLIFIEFPFMPLTTECRELVKKSIFWLDGSQDGWSRDLLSLLQLPQEELLARWQAKSDYRAELEEKFFFGPEEDATKLAYDFIKQVSGVAETKLRISHESQ